MDNVFYAPINREVIHPPRLKKGIRGKDDWYIQTLTTVENEDYFWENNEGDLDLNSVVSASEFEFQEFVIYEDSDIYKLIKLLRGLNKNDIETKLRDVIALQVNQITILQEQIMQKDEMIKELKDQLLDKE